jgi:hypothetical protein
MADDTNDYDDDYEILSDRGFYNLIYKFDNSGNLESYTMETIDLDENVFSSYFDMVAYIVDIKKSYKSKSAMMHQFEKDYNRQNILLNKKKYDIDKFCIELNKILQENNYSNDKVDQFDITYESLILLLCCQSTFSLPYMILLNAYQIDNSVNVLSCGCNNEDFSNIIINIDKNDIKLDLNTTLYIKDIESNSKIKKINLAVTCQFPKQINLPESIKKCESLYCIFSWITINLIQ